MVVLGGGAVIYERGTPVTILLGMPQISSGRVCILRLNEKYYTPGSY